MSDQTIDLVFLMAQACEKLWDQAKAIGLENAKWGIFVAPELAEVMVKQGIIIDGEVALGKEKLPVVINSCEPVVALDDGDKKSFIWIAPMKEDRALA